MARGWILSPSIRGGGFKRNTVGRLYLGSVRQKDWGPGNNYGTGAWHNEKVACIRYLRDIYLLDLETKKFEYCSVRQTERIRGDRRLLLQMSKGLFHEYLNDDIFRMGIPFNIIDVVELSLIARFVWLRVIVLVSEEQYR